jgi:hypothetical protein
MKHSLIILISLILLSSPVIGDRHIILPVSGGNGETLYRWENPSGDGYVWKYFGDNNIHRKYVGEVENGVPNGLGFLTLTNGSIYVGEWSEGFPYNVKFHKLKCLTIYGKRTLQEEYYYKTLRDPRCRILPKSSPYIENGKEIKRDKNGKRIIYDKDGYRIDKDGYRIDKDGWRIDKDGNRIPITGEEPEPEEEPEEEPEPETEEEWFPPLKP